MEKIDQDLNRILKKSKRRRFGKTILIPVAILLILFLGYAKYFNQAPFSKEKVVGLPNNTIRLNPAERDSLFSLIFSQSGSLIFNSQAKEAKVVCEFYEKGQMKQREVLLEGGFDDDGGDFNGSLSWAYQDGTDGKKHEFLIDLKSSYASWNGKLELDQFKYKSTGGDTTATSYVGNRGQDRFLLPGYEKIAYGKKIPILTINNSGRHYADFDLQMSSKDINQQFYFYLILEK